MTFTFHLTAGDGIGRYLNSSTNFALADQLSVAITTVRHGRCEPGLGHPVRDDHRVRRRNRLPALVDGQSAVELQLRHQPPRHQRRGSSGWPSLPRRTTSSRRARQHHLEPGLVRRCRPRVHVGQSPGGRRCDRPARCNPSRRLISKIALALLMLPDEGSTLHSTGRVHERTRRQMFAGGFFLSEQSPRNEGRRNRGDWETSR